MKTEISPLKKLKFKFLIILIIVSLGVFLRITNISPYKFYPDAYQSLIVAQNIEKLNSVIGYLGTNGMSYPDFFAWTRPGYPILINLLTTLTNNAAKSSQLISLLSGIIAIPIAFLLIKAIFKSYFMAASGTLILSLSFNHIVWSGFIMTETTGALFLLIFLWRLLSKINFKSTLANTHDLLLGVLFALSIITRYEYILLFFAIVFLIIKESPNPIIRLINIASSTLFTLSIFLSYLFPLQPSIKILFSETEDLMKITLVLFTAIILIFFFIKFVLKKLPKKIFQIIPKLFTISLIFLIILFVIERIFNPNNYFFAINYIGIKKIITTDILMSIFSFYGVLLMLRSTAFHKNIALFVVISSLTLGLTYYKVNPEMQRYFTHLIPFLLIPASFALYRAKQFTLKSKNKLFLFFIIFIIAIQAYLSYNGIKHWGDRSWFKISYEEKAARIVNQRYRNKDYLLIASFPEPYYYFSNMSTHSLTDNYPFLYIDDLLNNKDVLLILDMGMRDQFPNFSKFLDSKMKEYTIGRFLIHTTYHYTNMSSKEKYPVTIYKINLGKLKNEIKNFLKLAL